jgi:hypothetical protein
MTFQNPLDPDNSQIKKAIIKWLTQKWNLSENTVFDITEYKCSEPSCVHTETHISITDTEGGDARFMSSRHFKVSKPLVYIRQWDIQNMQEIFSKKDMHHHS